MTKLAWPDLLWLIAGLVTFTSWVLAMCLTSPSDAGPIERRPR